MKRLLYSFLFCLLPLQLIVAADGMVVVDEDHADLKNPRVHQREITDDLVKTLEAPGAPRKESKKKRENLIFSIQSLLGDGENDTAIVIYPLANKKVIETDRTDDFAQDLDRKFFKEASRKVFWSGMGAGVIGLIPSSPSCGFIIDKTGNFLRVPISSLEDKLFIAWILVTTTPVFAQQFFVLGKDVASSLLSEDPFDVSRGEGDEDKPHVFKKSKPHSVANIALVGSTVINAAIPTILMRQVEINFPVFVAITISPFYLAWAESYFRSGYANIHRLFEFYSYTSKINYQKREILKGKLLDFQIALERDDFVLKIFDTIQKEKERSFSGREGTPFAFSALFLKSAVRMMGNPEAGDETSALLMNYKLDVDASPHSAFDDFSGWFNTFLTGAGSYIRYDVYRYVLSSSFVEMGISPDTAFYTSAGLAAFEAGYRLITSHDDQKEFLTGIKGIFKRTTNLTPVRKLGGIVSFLNGSLFSLPFLVAGLHVYKDYSLSSKIGYLTPAYLLEVIRYSGYFNRQSNSFIDSVSVAKSTNLGIVSKRAYLKRYSDKALYYMDHFDVETIEQLYRILQQGI